MAGESLPEVAELPYGRRCQRGERCVRRPAGRGAALDDASARARPHAARLESRGMAPDPPTGGRRDLCGWVAEGGAAGVRRAAAAAGLSCPERYDCFLTVSVRS